MVCRYLEMWSLEMDGRGVVEFVETPHLDNEGLEGGEDVTGGGVCLPHPRFSEDVDDDTDRFSLD